MGWGRRKKGWGEVTVHPSVCVPWLFLENIFRTVQRIVTKRMVVHYHEPERRSKLSGGRFQGPSPRE